MAERRLPGLQRVLGVNALFSTAYGNVGSSIYYALGPVASFALGLTPIVFVLTGVIFYLTAATYAEATAMYPEAGGSSSFARHAFNEFWSFFAALGQMLNYVITIAISAFFVPHYIGGLFWPFLNTSPGADRPARSGHWDKVRAGQTGRRIVDEARAMHAGAIVMPMTRGGAGFGRALETVLRERPCRVIIESTPTERPRRTPIPA